VTVSKGAGTTCCCLQAPQRPYWSSITRSKFKKMSQYNETKAMHFSFNLLRFKSLYMFRALLAHRQKVLHKRHLVYCMRIMTLCAPNIPNVFCVAPPEDEQVMHETYRGPWFSINWMKSASRWFHYTDILWCTVSKTLSLKMSVVESLWDLQQRTLSYTGSVYISERTDYVMIRKTNCFV
jgi:hypothetical protein